jgi:hypothetical protein
LQLFTFGEEGFFAKDGDLGKMLGGAKWYDRLFVVAILIPTGLFTHADCKNDFVPTLFR